MPNRNVTIDQQRLGPDDWGSKDVGVQSVIGRSSKNADTAVPMVELNADHKAVALMSAAKARQVAGMLLEAAAAAETDTAAFRYLRGQRFAEDTILGALAKFSESRLAAPPAGNPTVAQIARAQAMQDLLIVESTELTAFLRTYLERRGTRGDELERIIAGLAARLTEITDDSYNDTKPQTPPTA